MTVARDNLAGPGRPIPARRTASGPVRPLALGGLPPVPRLASSVVAPVRRLAALGAAVTRSNLARPVRVATGVALAGAVAFLLAACGSATNGSGTPAPSVPAAPAPTTDSGASSPPPTQAPPRTGTTGAPTAAPVAAPAGCLLSNLRVTTGQSDAASGHRSLVLVFTNQGTAICRLYGYPGVAGLDNHGAQIAQATRTSSGYLGGLTAGTKPSNVDLKTGGSASAMVEASAFNADGSACVAYAGLLVTPPNETHSIMLAWGNDGCAGLQIHPVVPGSTGR